MESLEAVVDINSSMASQVHSFHLRLLHCVFEERHSYLAQSGLQLIFVASSVCH